MTNKEIIAKIEAAGHQVPANLNRTKLEALAAEKGVSLDEPTPEPTPENGAGTTRDGGVQGSFVRAGGSALPGEDNYDQNRMITPVMAVCAIAGDAAKVEIPEAGGDAGGDRDVPTP